ncbi:MAG: DUF2975 domain-containing protein [Candidatus Saccharimonas sp.]
MKTHRVTHGSTLFLRLAAGVIGLSVLALCVLLLPVIWVDAYTEFPRTGYAVRAVVAAMYLTAIPFYIGIYEGWRLLSLINKGRAFSQSAVTMLRTIAYCAGIISAIYLLMLPFFYLWQDEVDAPGLLVIGLFLCGMPLIVSVAMGLLGHLLAEATKIKSENELTV